MAVPFVIPEGAIPLDQLPPEDQAELQSISPPVAPAVPEGAIPMDELIRTASPEDLFDLTVQSADSDSPFDPKRYLVNNPEIRKDDNLVRKLADADAYVRDRGFELSDIDFGKALGGLWHIGKSFVYDRPKMGLSAAASAVKSQTADTEEEREKEKLKWLRGTTEALAAQELAAFDFIGLFNKAGGKVKDLVSSPLTRPPDERLNDFLSRADDDVQRDNISKGKGATFEAIFGEGVAENLAAAGEAVDPEVVSAVSASDPLVFMAFPGGIKIVHAATGKVLGSAVSKIGAGKIVSTLRRAERAAAQSTAKSEAAAGRVGALEAGPAVAAPLIVESTPVLERMAQTQAGVARTAAVTAAEEANVSQAVLRSAEEAFNASTPAKLMVGADRLVQPIRQGAEEMISRTIDAGLGVGVGAVGLGATLAEKLGKTIAAFIPPIATPRALRTSYELAGQGGKRLLGVSKELFKGKQSSYSPALTMASDLFATVPITASGAARGLVTMDIPFAAVASERPEDTAHMPVIGAFLGGAGRAVPIARQIVRNQRIRARDYGSDAPLRDYRNASGLDAGNKFSVEQGEPGQASRLSALRQMLEPTGAQMYWLSDPKQFADAIRRYIPGKTEAWYENASRTKGVADVIIDDAGQPKKVIILNDLEAAEHEAVHPIEKILGKRATDEVFDLIYDEYLPIWEQFGESYARQFTSSEQWQNYLARGEGWREAVLDASQGTTEWRNQLTPDQIHEFGDRYIAGEFLAEAGDAIIKHAGPDIVTSPSFPGKLARILGKILVGFGVEPFAGVETVGQKIPLGFETTEKLATALKRGVNEAAVERSRPDVGGVPPYSPKGKPRPPVEPRSGVGVVPPKPVEPTEPVAAAEEARAIAAEVSATPAARGQRSSKEVLGDIAENIATGEGLKVDYRSAPGEPAGAISSDRTTRRAIIEAFRVMPQSARALFEKLFFPDRVIKTAGGKIQVMGWAPEVFAANAHKLASSLKEAGELNWWNQQFPRYGVDAKSGTFTEPGWRALYDDVQVFTRNQRAGETGSGEPLVVPAATEAQGFRAPLPRDVPAGALEQKYADVISSLFGIPVPRTPRVTGGRYPRNLAGQEVSEATMPGRVSKLVQPRAPFEGAAAEELGITGRQLKEVNPVRAELESRGVKPSYIEAIQRLNLESIADVTTVGANVPQFRGAEFTLQAGFLPKPKDPRAIKSAAVRFRNGKIYEGQLHGNALEAGYKAGEMDSSAMEDGFTTNSGEFLGREAALERAIELEQLSKRKDDGGLESFTFDVGRRFQPRLEETVQQIRDADMDQLRELVKAPSRFGSSLTGFAYELGAGLKEANQLRTLEDARQFHVSESKRALQAKDYGSAALNGNKAQILREAIEFSTGTGSGEMARVRDFPDFEPPLRDAKFQPREASRDDVISEYHDRRDNQLSYLVSQLKTRSKKITWPVVPAARLKKIWLDFGKSGVVRDEKGMQNIADQISDNIARLSVATELTGHTPRAPRDLLESGGHSLSEKQLDRLGDLLFDDNRLSDYALEPLERLVLELGTAKTAEDQLYAVDKILNEVHHRSDLASNFVEGGSKTLSEIATQGGPTTGAKFQPREAKTEAGKKLEKEGFEFANTSDRVEISKGGKVVGSLYFTNFGETAKIHEIWVMDAFRKQGLGEALYREVFTDLKDLGVGEVTGLVINPVPLKIRNRISPEQTFSRPAAGGAIEVRTFIPKNAKFQPTNSRGLPQPVEDRVRETFGILSKAAEDLRSLKEDSSIDARDDAVEGLGTALENLNRINRGYDMQDFPALDWVRDVLRDSESQLSELLESDSFAKSGDAAVVQKIADVMEDLLKPSSGEARFQPGLDPERDRGFVGRLSSSGSVNGRWGDLGLLTHEQQGFRTGDRFRYNPETNSVYWWEMPDEMAQDVVSSWVEKQGNVRPKHLPTHEENWDAAHGTRFLPDPNKDVEDVAVKYAKDIGLTYTLKLNILELNPELSKKIADYYQNSKSDPEDAAVKKSYDALIDETKAQWKAIEDAGYTMVPSKTEPYKTSKEMLDDVRENRNLSFLKISPETIKSEANNPMLRSSGVGDLVVNDLFRAVHDFFGHAKEGYQFGPKGELNAWRAHSEMFSPEAQGALAAETLAQNSWVNFGPHLRDSAGKIAERGEEGYVAPPDRPFAPQKNIILPEKLLREVVETLRSVRSDPRREVLPVEPLERLAELQEQTEPDMGGNAQFMPTLAQLEAKWAREERLAARRKPVKKKPTFQMITGIAGGFSKAWLQPDGEPIQLGGTWHHEWLAENAKAVGEQWNITLKQAKSSDADISRKAALEAGFARVNLGLSNGALTVELRAKDIRKHKKSIFDLVEQNSGLVDNITITLFDDAVRNVLDNASESVFRYDTAEKLEHIPFITTGPEAPASTAGGSKRGPGAIARARALPDAAQFQTRKPKGYFANEYWVGPGGLQFSKYGHEEAAVNYLKKVAPDLGIKHSGGLEETAEQRYSTYNEMENRGWLRATETGEAIEIDSSSLIKSWDEIPRKSRQALEDIAFEKNKPILFDNKVAFEKPRPDTGFAQFQTSRRGETEGLPGMEVPREPLTPRARASMTLQDLRKHFPEAVVPRELGESIPSEIVDSPLFKRAGDEQTAVEQFAKRVVDFAREYESEPAFEAGKKWYSEFTPTLKKQFGKDAQLMAELLAATSPNTSVEVNYAYAFDALTSLRKGRFDKIVPKFEEGLEKIEDASWENWYARELKAGNVKAPPASPTPASFLAHWIDKFDLKPKQSNGKLYGQHSLPVLRVFSRRWLDLNRGPKTKNFVENLLGKSHEATVDIWADRTMRWAGYEGFQDRWRVLPENSAAVSDADFSFSQKVFRAAAEELGMKPSDLQGALWFAEKKRWSDNGWSRLDLGDFRKEIKKNSLLIKGYDQRLRTSQAENRSSEQMGLDVEPRFK